MPTETKAAQTLDELAAERNATFDKIATLQARYQEMTRSQDENMRGWDMIPGARPFLVKHQNESLAKVTGEVEAAQKHLQTIDQQIAAILRREADQKTAELRAELRSVLDQMGDLCDELDAAHFEGRERWDKLDSLYRQALNLHHEIDKLGARSGRPLYMPPPSVALKARFAWIEQKALAELDHRGHNRGKHNPARATLREAMGLPEKGR